MALAVTVGILLGVLLPREVVYLLAGIALTETFHLVCQAQRSRRVLVPQHVIVLGLAGLLALTAISAVTCSLL
jgi:hypothetical protein